MTLRTPLFVAMETPNFAEAQGMAVDVPDYVATAPTPSVAVEYLQIFSVQP